MMDRKKSEVHFKFFGLVLLIAFNILFRATVVFLCTLKISLFQGYIVISAKFDILDIGQDVKIKGAIFKIYEFEGVPNGM